MTSLYKLHSSNELQAHALQLKMIDAIAMMYNVKDTFHVACVRNSTAPRASYYVEALI